MALEVANRKVSVVVVLLGLAVLIQHGECDHGDHHKMIQECVEESGVSPDLVKKAFHDGEFTEDEKLKCFFKCIHTRAGDMDETGKIDPQQFVEKLSPKIGQDKAAQIIMSCKDSKGKDPCDTAFILSQCMRAEFVKLGIDTHQ